MDSTVQTRLVPVFMPFALAGEDPETFSVLEAPDPEDHDHAMRERLDEVLEARVSSL